MTVTNISQAVMRHRDLKAELLAQYPDLGDDLQALEDTLEGISDIDDVIAALIEEALTRKAMADGIAEREKELAARKSRLTVGAEKMRSAALWAMQEAGRIKITRPGFTASVGQTRPAVVITDETLISRKFGKTEWKPDKSAIADALKAGETVDGATLSNQRATLTVRTS